MADGMSPEKSSINAFRSLGTPAILPGVAETSRAAQNFPQPEAKGFVPDIRMQGGGGEDDRDPNKERMEHEMRMQEMYGEGKAGYMGAFLSSVSSLSRIEKDTRLQDGLITEIKSQINEIKGIKDRIKSERSKDKNTAHLNLKTEKERLEAILADPTVTIDANKKAELVRNLVSITDVLNEDLVLTERGETEKRVDALENERRRIAESYVNVVHSCLDEIGSLNKYLENLKNPYPYDSRWNVQFFEQTLERVTDKLRSKERLNPESQALLEILKRDLLWASSNARVVEAMGPAFEVYFDGELMLQWVRTPHTELVARDFIRLNSKALKGAELSDAQRELVKLTLSKRKGLINTRAEADGSITERLGLREVAIDYQDAYIKWLYSAVAAGQKNLDVTDAGTWTEDPNGQEEGEHYAKIDLVTYRFLSEVLALDDAKTFEYINKDGKKFQVKDKVLNPFCMPRNDEKANMAFFSRMQVLVANGNFVDQEILRIKNIADPTRQAEEIKKLAAGLIKQADERVKNWEALDENGPYDRLADAVIRSVTNVEKGVLAGGDLGWTWQYEQDKSYKILTDSKGEYISRGKTYKKDIHEHIWRGLVANIKAQTDATGEFIEDRVYKADVDKNEWKDLTADFGTSGDDVKLVGRMDQVVRLPDGSSYVIRRKSEMGSIYENHDVTTVAFLARHIIDYDTLADTRGGGILVFPTIGSFRARWESEPPYFRPRLEEFAKNDPKLLSRLGIGTKGEIVPGGILSENNPLENKTARKAYLKGKNGIQEQKYGKFDTRARDFIKNNVWAYQTPFLENPGDPNSDYLSMPIFIPTMLDINFWKGVSLDKPSARTSDHKSMSIWHRRLEGAKNSELDWENMDKYKYSWIRVTHDQMERWLGPIITPHEFNRATQPEYEKHNLKPNGVSEKESGKRARLGGRMFDYDDGVLRVTSFAQNKILASVRASGIMGLDLSGPTVLGNELAKWQASWVARWTNTELDMPYKVRKIYNYPGTAAQIMALIYLQSKKIISSMAKHSTGQATDVSGSLTSLEKTF